MLDNHYTPEGYGIIRNFTFGENEISTYTFFVMLGLLIGTTFFYLTVTNKEKVDKDNSYLIVISALIGGLIGSKIPVIFENINILIKDISYLKNFIFTGKSIIGGLIGGYLGVKLIKKIKNLNHIRCGNQIAPAIALSMAVGRIGCFLTGCCYGIETSLPIGIDFGDGIYRIPTQIIEIIFCLVLFGYLLYKQKKDKNLIPGILFKELIMYYFVFRFFIEFIRGTNKNILFLSVYQVICLLGFVIIKMQMKRSKKYETIRKY